MGTQQIIDLIEVTDRDGNVLWTEPDAMAPVKAGLRHVDQGTVVAGDRPVSQIPQERFAADPDVYPDSMDMVRMIEQIREAEQGRNATPVAVQPDGKIVPTRPGQHDTVASTVPRERFAAAPLEDSSKIRALDPQGQCSWRWHESVQGWTFTLRPDIFGPSPYTFLARREPAQRNEWFAYCVEPNLDHLVGHQHHLQNLDGNTVVCLRPGFRGHQSLEEVHGALAKWCLYIEFVRRGLPAPFSA